jgi:cyclophilin family peptidyl-prolyl cis-trans isomerase/HEAT repeat protein
VCAWLRAALALLAAAAVLLGGPALAAARLDPVSSAADGLAPEAAALVSGRTSPQAAVRAQVATAYGRILTPVCVDPLLGMLHDRSPAVREAVLFALGQFGWKAEYSGGREAEIADAVAARLDDRDPGVRLAAVSALGRVGLARTPDLVGSLLADSSERVRAEALMALFRYRHVLRLRSPSGAYPDLPQAIVDAILPLATDPDPLVRRNAVYCFARFKDARGLALARRLSADHYVWTRFFAQLALARIADPSAAPEVEAGLEDRDFMVRRAAVQAAAAIGRADLAGRLRGDRRVHVRSAVAAALGSSLGVSDETAAGWLRTLAADARREVRAAAVVALAQRLKEAAAAGVLAALADRDEYVRAAAVQAAGSLDAAARAQVVDAAGRDGSVAVRCALLTLFAKDPGPAALAALRAGAACADADVRSAAVSALAARSEPEALDVAWQAYLASADPRYTFVRQAAVPVMKAFAGDDSAGDQSTAHLREMLADPRYVVAHAAYAALAARGVPGVEPPSEVATLTSSPYRDLSVSRFPLVRLETSRGVIVIRCYRDAAPVHVANFVGMVRSGFFDGKTWQRVVPDFVVQGGSPSLLGGESRAYQLRAEINPLHFGRGAVGMSRDDLLNSGDSQLFITHVQAPHLDDNYTLFGQVVSGFAALDRLEAGDVILKATVAGRAKR